MNRRGVILSLGLLVMSAAALYAQRMPRSEAWIPRTDDDAKAKVYAVYERAMRPDVWPEPEGLAPDQRVMHLEMSVDGDYRKALPALADFFRKH